MKKKANPHDRKNSVLFFWLAGLVSLIWFLVRVIPKPSRAAYPCQRAAFPVASGFVIYLTGLVSSSILLKIGIRNWRLGRLAGILFIFPVLIIALISSLRMDSNALRADSNITQYIELANQPVGIARGVVPGRVVWVWNPEAVNENCPNTWLENDNWWMEHNTDRLKVQDMLASSICLVTGKDSAVDAWNEIFRYYNRVHGKEDVPYQEGEKVCIKANLVSCNATNMDGHNKKENLNMIDVSPQLMWAILNQLSNVYGIPQSNICIGDPSAYFPDQYWDLLNSDFPEIIYLSEADGADGRTKIISSAEEVLKFSDGSGGDYLPVQFTEADYMINISVTKHHGSSGFTQIAKNHYGTNMRNSAEHMHSTLVNIKQGYGKYRHFVDLLGHRDLGGKTILNIGDFLWSGHDAWTTPVKFTAEPFSNDYPSSLLVSIDPIAVESVGLDLIQTQAWDDQYATTAGVDDYLYQGADSSYWPGRVRYDPENDGTIIESLGVFEHWNNDIDRQYSGNLGISGGIELVMSIRHKKIVSPTEFTANYVQDPSSICLSWKDLSEKEDTYILERSESEGNNFIVLAELNPDEISYEDKTVEPGNLYYYRIRTVAGDVTTIAETIAIMASSATGNSVSVQSEVPFRVFPNPASDIIYIYCTGEIVVTGIKIFDMNGNLLKQFTTENPGSSNLFTYDCREIPNGSYIIQLKTKDGSWGVPLLVVK